MGPGAGDKRDTDPEAKEALITRVEGIATSDMASIKNEHIVWAYGDREDGKGQAVIVGVTEQGLQYLRNNPGMTLTVNPPGTGFANVTNIVVFHEKDKATLKQRLRESGVQVSEVN